jgi:tetratricopeptide (TPR) repeat protein
MSWQYAWVHFAVDLYHSFSNYYRPIQMLTYMVDFSLWRLEPFGYHLTNVLLHILVSLSLFVLLKLMTDDRRVAFIGTLFYALHPAHTAAVTYIAGRADPLVALLSMLSLILFHYHFKAQNKYKMSFLYIGSSISFLLALLSKEVAVIFPAIILTYRLFFIEDREVEKSRDVIKFHYISLFIVILGVYVLLRMHALNFQGEGIIISRQPLYSRALTSLKALGMYFVIIFLPLKLHMERSIPYVQTFFENDFLLSTLLLLFMFWLVVRVKRISKMAFFGFLFFIISLLPVMNIYPMGSNMAEHWLYIPLIGITISLSCLGLKLWDGKKGLRPLLSLLALFYLLFFSYRTFDRNFDWRDEYTIFTHTFNYTPKSIKILNNMGNLFHKEGNFDTAVIFHKKALEINPEEHKTHFNLGHDYEKMGMDDRALQQYEKSIKYKPDYAKAHFNIGNFYLKKGQHDKAIAAYKRAAQCDDFHIGTRNNLGNIYFGRGLYDRAKDKYEEVVKINPYLPGAHNNLANALSRLGFCEEAIDEYKKAIELMPEDADYHFGLGTVYGKLEKYDEAIQELEEAHHLKPSDIDILINLGVTYFHKGDLTSAEKEWQKAQRINPENDMVVHYLKKLRNKEDFNKKNGHGFLDE